MSPAPQHVTDSSSTSSRPTFGASACVAVSSSFADNDARQPLSYATRFTRPLPNRRNCLATSSPNSFRRTASCAASRLRGRLPAGRHVRLRERADALGRAFAGDERPRERVGPLVDLLERLRAEAVAVREAGQRALALDDAGEALASLRLGQVVEPPRLDDVLGDVQRERRRHLPLAREVEREARLLDRRDDALRLRHQLGLAQPARRLRRHDEPLRVLRAHVAVDALLDRLGAELGDRVARVDALRAALVAEVAARALPDPVLAVQRLEPLDLAAVARVTDEAHRFRERLRPEELRVRLHRVALRDAAAAVDAERLLVDHVHALLADAVLAAVRRLLVARLQERVDAAELPPEGAHVDDEVLQDLEVPHGRDHRHVAGLCDVVHARLARENRGSVHAHAARTADHHAAALAVGERPVVAVLDDVEAVEERRLLGRVDLVLLQAPLARRRVEAPDLEGDLHQGSLVVRPVRSSVWSAGGTVTFTCSP